ncbi:putative membrane protein [Babesia divergens]|uniref:BOS complex subunit TMEM147 n=1 Tax=Babesia divergens TaxID=32595 RepID=A0AAD9LKX1_BABDI|nr:putative membrane protein [Babesia divergens]
MKLLQVPTCIVIILAPYWILYNKTQLRENFNNGGLAVRAIGYYFLANCIKVFVMATGVPELIGNYLLGERVVISLLDCSIYIGLALSLRGNTNIVVGTGLGWSIPENIGRLTFETVRCAQQLDYSDRFMYAALRTNLHVLSSVVFAGIFFMWLRSKEKRCVYTSFAAIAMIIFPVLST